MRTVLFIAVFGLIASALAHFSTFLGVNPQRAVPWVWMLHFLIFVVWIPAIASVRKTCSGCSRRDFWKTATRDAPRWMKAMCAVLFAYAFFNFFFTIFVLNEGGGPHEIDGKKVLSNHGRIIRALTDEEYELHQAYVVRTFSGHWMVFYAIGMTVLYSGTRRNSGPQEGTDSPMASEGKASEAG